ncbi:hypothetical protein LCL98_13140 [Rossellomorea aquimaris]|nr:hypothetical protein [Rossellomorea aquimaris]
MQKHRRRNTPAFTVLSYFTFFAGILMFSVGLYNADLTLSEKGFYVSVMILVAVGAILTQKVARDNSEDDQIIIAEQERNFALSSGKSKPSDN